MTKSIAALVFVVFASCASLQESPRIVVAITGMEAKDPGESEVLAKAAEERLKEAFSESRRFTLVERRRLADVLREQKGDQVGRLVGADWVLYGVIDWWGVRFTTPGLVAEAQVRLTVVRVVDGQILFSKGAPGSASGLENADDDTLLLRATLESVDKLLAEIDRLPR